MKVLVVNADDLGISPGVNRGIIESHRSGLVSSTSLLANLPGFEDAVARLAECPELGTGVHLNLTSGSPVVGPPSLPSLVSRHGCFHSAGALLARLAAFAVRRGEVEREFAAQVAKVAEAGIRVTHLDSHRNIHLHPLIRDCVRVVAERFGIRWVRFQYQAPLMPAGVTAAWPARIRNRLKRLLAVAACRFAPGGHSVDGKVQRAIFGAPQMELSSFREALATLIGALSDGVTELVCHPGYVDEELGRLDRYTTMREAELSALTDPEIRGLVERLGVRLTNYGHLD